MALAIIVTTILHEMLPASYRVIQALVYFYPILTLGFLAVMIIGDPGRIDKQSRWLRVTTATLITTMLVGNTLSALHLVIGILDKSNVVSPRELLAIGTVIWITNVTVFALSYWDLDQGGAVARFHQLGAHRPAFIFPEMNNREYVDPNWYPQFPDYLSLSFNTALAFSNTDISPVKRWAKMLMLLQSMVSLTLVALVLARAVNVL